MGIEIAIERSTFELVRSFLTSGPMEEAAFLFAEETRHREGLHLRVCDVHLAPPEAWSIRREDQLELADEERARVLRIARSTGAVVIDCHSHPGAGDFVRFSLLDRRSILEFVPYVRWKLDRRTFVATVWSADAIDAVAFVHNDTAPSRVHAIRYGVAVVRPRWTWPTD